MDQLKTNINLLHDQYLFKSNTFFFLSNRFLSRTFDLFIRILVNPGDIHRWNGKCMAREIHRRIFRIRNTSFHGKIRNKSWWNYKRTTIQHFFVHLDEEKWLKYHITPSRFLRDQKRSSIRMDH